MYVAIICRCISILYSDVFDGVNDSSLQELMILKVNLFLRYSLLIPDMKFPYLGILCHQIIPLSIKYVHDSPYNKGMIECSTESQESHNKQTKSFLKNKNNNRGNYFVSIMEEMNIKIIGGFQ